MKNEDLKKLRESFIELQAKRDNVLSIKREILELENNSIVKRYMKLQEELEEKTTGRNTGFDNYTDEDLIRITFNEIEIEPDQDIYVYLGTFKYNNECDIVHGSSDIEVSRTCADADYILYGNLELRYNSEIEIPYSRADEFEKTHKIIYPKNVASKYRYFYELQIEYFKTMILETPEKANNKIKELVKIIN